MRHFRVGVAVVVFTLMLAAVLPAQLTETVAPGQVRTFQITAENYRFSPFNIIVNQNDKVRFVITAADHDYEFRLKAYDIKEKVAQGIPATINWPFIRPWPSPHMTEHSKGNVPAWLAVNSTVVGTPFGRRWLTSNSLIRIP